jgi:tRNA G18 (ribose-2'-O)-methylase SpoU
MDFDISLLSDLKEKDFSLQGLMALEGRIVIEKAIEAGIEIIGLACSKESPEEWLGNSSGKFPIRRIGHKELCDIVGFRFHHGAIAVAKRPELTPFHAGVFATESHSVRPNAGGAYLCMWNVTDPSNVGALIRSAVGLGASAVLLSPGCADPYYRKALRASMGNAFSLPLYSCDAGTLDELGKAGFEVVAATLSPAAIPIGTFVPRRPIALIVGNEGFGIPADIVALCGTEVYIPMAAGVDSLNVVVAAGICMYELFGKIPPVLTRP